jgi:serine protease Do
MARTELNATRGNFESVYQGPVWVLDATTNNPGAAGGALVDFQGRMVGMLGKELRDENTGIWLSYALPIAELQESINKIIAGESIRAVNTSRKASDRPASLSKLGIALVPDVLEKTPAFIDTVQPDSPAARAGLRSDDLVLFLNSIRIDSQATLRDELNYIDQSDQVTLLLQRGSEIREFTLAP